MRAVNHTNIAMTTNASPDALLKLMTWLSPSFPVGAYAYSHGLELAMENELVTDPGSLSTWLEGILLYGAGRTDGILFAETWRAVTEGDRAHLNHVLEWARALRPTKEMALESNAQGAAFLDAVVSAWPSEALKTYMVMLAADGKPLPYSVAVGLVTALHVIPLGDGLGTFVHAFAANLVSAGVRLIPLGQTAGQQVLAGLTGLILDQTQTVQSLTLEDIGSAAVIVDWTSAAHETQYTRLFRS